MKHIIYIIAILIIFGFEQNKTKSMKHKSSENSKNDTIIVIIDKNNPDVLFEEFFDYQNRYIFRVHIIGHHWGWNDWEETTKCEYKVIFTKLYNTYKKYNVKEPEIECNIYNLRNYPTVYNIDSLKNYPFRRDLYNKIGSYKPVYLIFKEELIEPTFTMTQVAFRTFSFGQDTE